MSALRRQRLQRFVDADLYVVTSQELSDGRASLDILDAALAGGCRLVQLREKALSTRALCELGRAFRERTRRAGALLMVNDRLDVALAVDADGVHLGQDDLPLDAARRLAPELLLGVSTHDADELARAQAQGADVVNLGPLFETGSKPHAATLGVDGLRRLAPLARVPFSVMGGITADRLEPVLDAGARCVAVITAVTRAADPQAATRAMIQQIRAARRPR